VFTVALIFCSSCNSSTEPSLLSKFEFKADNRIWKTSDVEIPEILKVGVTIKNVSNSSIKVSSSCGAEIVFYTNPVRSGEPVLKRNNDSEFSCSPMEKYFMFLPGEIQKYDFNIYNLPQKNPFPIGTYFVTVNIFLNKQKINVDAGQVSINP